MESVEGILRKGRRIILIALRKLVALDLLHQSSWFAPGCNAVTMTFDTQSHVTNLPDSVTTLAPSAFLQCRIISITGPHWTLNDGSVMRLTKVLSCLGSPSHIRIPGSVREICDRVLCDRNLLMDLGFEEGLLKVGVSAFERCSRLKKADFPASLIVIEANAFLGCTGLGQITFAVAGHSQWSVLRLPSE
jgi:hypothetical protein